MNLVPAEQKTVLFYDDEITAVRLADGRVFIPVRPLVERLGIDWNGQRRRINRDAVLKEEVTCVDVVSTQGDVEQRRAMLCLPQHMLQMWVDSINVARLKPEARKRVILRQSRGKYKERDGFVYIIKATEGTGSRSYFKIGRTCTSPKRYLRQLQMRNPLPLSIEYVVKCKESVSYRLEKALHDRFADKRMHGEWFLLGSNDLTKAQEVTNECINTD